MRTTKFRILEFTYIVTTYMLLFHTGIYIINLIIHIIDKTDFADFLNLFIIPIAATVAIVIGYCTIAKLLVTTLPTYYRQNVSIYANTPYPQKFSVAELIGAIAIILIPFFVAIFSCLAKQSVENGIKLYLYILNYCSIISVCLIPVMLLTSYFTRHYRRIQPPQAPRDR